MNIEDNPNSGNADAGAAAAAVSGSAATNTAATAPNSDSTNASNEGGEKGADTSGSQERKNADGSAMTAEQIAAADKAIADKAAWDAGPPDSYTFTLPDGFELPEDRARQASEFFSKLGLSQAKAQEAIDTFCKAEGENVSLLMATLEQKRLDDKIAWGEESKKALGDNFVSTMKLAGNAVEFTKDAQLKADWEEFGWGNRLSLIRTFAAFGKLLADSPLRGINNEVPTGGGTEVPVESRMYPSMTKP